jgi:hypothetical protein
MNRFRVHCSLFALWFPVATGCGEILQIDSLYLQEPSTVDASVGSDSSPADRSSADSEDVGEPRTDGDANDQRCEPGFARCSGRVPQFCDQGGDWQSGVACQARCESGACAGRCPSTEPSGVCTSQGEECVYGDDIRPGCRTRVKCTNQTWTPRGDAKCDVSAPYRECDGGWDIGNTPCATGSNEACVVDRGAAGKFCVCFTELSSPHDSGQQGTWTCHGPPSGCPVVAPNIGQACSSPEGQVCDYPFRGLDCECTYAVKCTNGSWEWSQGYCMC